MNNTKLAILGILAVVTAGWAVLQSRMAQPVNAVDFSSSPLIEGLPIESIASITVSSEGGAKTVTLDRVDGKFVIKDRDNYPADVSKINSLLSKCLDIRARDKITSNAANHADLKVTPETARCVVSFNDKDGKKMAAIVLSESDVKTSKVHARLLSSDDVYEIDNDPWISTGIMEYIDTKLFETQQEKISRVAVQTPDEKYSLAVADGGASVTLEDVPDGKKQKDTECRTVMGALSYLQFEDVMKEAPKDAAFNYNYSCKLNDTTVYKLSMAKLNDKVYAKVSADFMDKTPVEKEQRTESDEELKKKEAKLLAIDEVNKFNQRHDGWVYQLPFYKAGDMTKALADLIEDKEEAAATTEAADASAEQAEKAEAAQPGIPAEQPAAETVQDAAQESQA